MKALFVKKVTRTIF